MSTHSQKEECALTDSRDIQHLRLAEKDNAEVSDGEDTISTK